MLARELPPQFHNRTGCPPYIRAVAGRPELPGTVLDRLTPSSALLRTQDVPIPGVLLHRRRAGRTAPNIRRS